MRIFISPRIRACWLFLNKNEYSFNFFKPKIEPIITYIHSLSNKSKILADNKNKSGIYRWVNKISNESYVGSSISLRSRFMNYYNNNYLSKRLLIGDRNIYKALLFYGYSVFDLEILEYCNKDSVVEREQYYIDILKPEYNILKIAGSRFGNKHTEKTQ